MSKMTDKNLINFIVEARKRGFSDYEIKKALMDNRWDERTVDNAFSKITNENLKNPKIKNQVCIFLSNDVLNALEKRAEKNMMNLEEQIQDILRRSCVRKKSDISQEKVDDFLISCFSRQSKTKDKKKNIKENL